MSTGLFVDHKKGEVDELRKQLRDPAIDKDLKAKRNVMEKVVGYMTLGIDVSSLFTEMVMVGREGRAPPAEHSRRLHPARHPPPRTS